MSSPYSTPGVQDSGADANYVASSVRQMQIITVALIIGALVFMGVTLFLTGGAFNTKPELLSWIGIGFSAFMLVAHMIVPNIAASAALKSVSPSAIRDQDETQIMKQLLPIYLTRHIMACAMLEGPAVLNLISYMVTEFVGNLVVAGVMILLLASRLISASAAPVWARDRARDIEMS